MTYHHPWIVTLILLVPAVPALADQQNARDSQDHTKPAPSAIELTGPTAPGPVTEDPEASSSENKQQQPTPIDPYVGYQGKDAARHRPPMFFDDYQRRSALRQNRTVDDRGPATPTRRRPATAPDLPSYHHPSPHSDVVVVRNPHTNGSTDQYESQTAHYEPEYAPYEADDYTRHHRSSGYVRIGHSRGYGHGRARVSYHRPYRYGGYYGHCSHPYRSYRYRHHHYHRRHYHRSHCGGFGVSVHISF